MAKTKLPKTEKEPFKWETWTNLGIQIVLVLITVFSFCETQKSTKSAQVSTKAAQDALALQQKQYEDAKTQESQRSLEDFEKRKKDIELIEQQILALKDQAEAIKEGVKNTEILQRPLLDVANLGFHFIADNELMFYYQIKNDGIKPASLDSAILYTFEVDFTKGKKVADYSNDILANDKYSQINQPMIIDGNKHSTITEEFVLSINSFYCYFILYYTDSFSKKKYDSHPNPIFFKWVKQAKKDHYIMNKDNDKYYTLVSCSKEEKRQIMTAVKKMRK
jgi:hypothetical protein